MESKKILIVHPYDRTTYFLNRVKNHIAFHFHQDVQVFNVHPNKESHNHCLEKIEKQPAGSLIIFLGHGKSESLYGSKGDFYDNIGDIDEDLILDYPDKYYYKESFIDSDNVFVLKNKKIFCLACNSNSSISDYAIDKEAIVFLGFGSIPTSQTEFIEFKNFNKNDFIKVSRLVEKVKSELNYIIKKSLFYAINNDLDFIGLLNLIHFITDQRIASITMSKKHPKEKYIIAEHLYKIKNSIIIKGDKSVKLRS